MKKGLFMIEKDDKVDVKRVIKKIFVNLLTFMRFGASFIIIPVFLSENLFLSFWLAFIFYSTDFVDGFLARKWKVQSLFGSYLDSISDKAFGITFLILLSTINPVFLIAILGELFISAVNVYKFSNDINVQSCWQGKVKTFVLAFTSVFSLLLFSVPSLDLFMQHFSLKGADVFKKISMLVSSFLVLVTNYFQVKTSIQYLNNKKEEVVDNHQELEKKKVPEVIRDLFDTDYYLQNKDSSVKKLLYKPKKLK